MSGPRGHLLFLMSLWLSLATAIICAVAPAGLPLTRTTGSAFDPSTTIVALRSRAPAPVKATTLRISNGDAPIGDGPAGLAAYMPSFIAGAAILRSTDRLLSRALAILPRAVPFALHARPPPAA